MLGTLTITNCFAHANSTFDFTTGMTAVTGPNFSGKSQILEMVRFALWGSAALRTQATDYKGARVNLTFIVKTIGYRVERTINNAKLFLSDELLATGTKPVNAKIMDIFGYGLEVFDTANVASQGMIEALGAMRPAERKRLVDSTIGLNVLDDLAKWCAEQGTSKKAELATVQELVKVPEEPVKPEGYLPLDAIQAERQRLTALHAEELGIQRYMSQEPMCGDEPMCTEFRTLLELETISRNRTAIKSQLDKLCMDQARLPPEPSMSLEDIEKAETAWDNHEAWNDATAFMSKYPKPIFTLDELDRFEAQLHTHDAWSEWKRLDAKGHHECPECHHQWPINQETMNSLGDWKGKDPPRQPRVNTLIAIAQHRTTCANFEATKVQRAIHRLILAAHPSQPPMPNLSRTQLKALRAAHVTAPQRAALQAEIVKLATEFAGVPDVTQAIGIRRSYEAALRAYQTGLEAWSTWKAKLPVWQARLVELAGTDAALEATVTLQVLVAGYDQAMVRYAREVDAYSKTQARIETLTAEADQYSRAKNALAEIKSRVKGYLVPSLSRVASMILSQMTGGVLGEVSVDENFDIMVGTKPIDGLSGCGKAAANLALRIGLGQVLTNRVFSVFMADEIDAAMDDDNARYTAECLANLTRSISQIILVSHKTPVADNYIRL